MQVKFLPRLPSIWPALFFRTDTTFLILCYSASGIAFARKLLIRRRISLVLLRKPSIWLFFPVLTGVDASCPGMACSMDETVSPNTKNNARGRIAYTRLPCTQSGRLAAKVNSVRPTFQPAFGAVSSLRCA